MRSKKYILLTINIILLTTLEGCCKEDLFKNEDNFLNKIIAHRGVWMNEILEQNSLKAINLSNSFGIWGCEIDVRETLDSNIVLSHDPIISNLTINHYTYHDLKEAATNEGRELATLAEALALLENIKGSLIIEIKDANVSTLNAIIDSYSSIKYRLSFMSFSKEICKSLIKEDLHPTYLLIDSHSINYTELLKDGYDGIAIDRDALIKDLDIIHNCKKNNLKILVWTVNDSSEIFSYLNWGVDYVITDIPYIIQ